MAEEKKAPTPPAEPKGGTAKAILSLVATAALAGAAAFGGARMGASAHAAGTAAGAGHASTAKPPGATIAIDPFLVSITEGTKPAHVIKMTLQLELKAGKKDEELKPFLPRVRDRVLRHLRAIPYDQVTSGEQYAKLPEELHHAIKELGVDLVEQVLITDFVAQ